MRLCVAVKRVTATAFLDVRCFVSASLFSRLTYRASGAKHAAWFPRRVSLCTSLPHTILVAVQCGYCGGVGKYVAIAKPNDLKRRFIQLVFREFFMRANKKQPMLRVSLKREAHAATII